ncbi:PASTA domain-containing protein [bacterium]|nr:PASTA domain-containing protein [bacterium]
MGAGWRLCGANKEAMLKRLFLFFYGMFKGIVFLIFLLAILFAGMGIGGFYLLDYIISGEEIQMPNLLGKNKATAIEMLTESGLILNLPIKEEYNEETPPGLVIAQQPYPGSLIKKGRGVYLTVSAGLQRFLVPDLIGKQEEKVNVILGSKGLSLGSKAMVHHPRYPKGTVIAQDPVSGPRMIQQKSVDVLISLGPRPLSYVMPSLQGMDKNSVMESIASGPFRLTEHNILVERTEEMANWNKVIRQKPEPGAKVMEDEALRIAIGSSGQEVEAPRMVRVRLPIPIVLNPEDLVILVWDDTSRIMNNMSKSMPSMPFGDGVDYNVEYQWARKVDYYPNPFEKRADFYCPVYGSALIMFGLEIDPALPAVPILPAQFIEQKKEKADLTPAR